MSAKKRFLVTALTVVLAVSLLLPSVMQRPAADTQTGFILLSPGRDGKIGTSDDMYATEKGDAVKGAIDTTKYSLTSSVLSKADVGKIILAADNTSVPADGKTAVTITATVVDKYNNPVPDGAVVNFTTSLGTLSQTSVKTANGMTATTITSTTAGTATITASCNGAISQISLVFNPVFLGFNISSWDKAIIDGNWYTYAQEYGPFYVTWKGSLSNMRLRIKAEPNPTRTNSAVWLYVLDTNNKYLPFEYIKNDKSAVTTSAPIGTVIYFSGEYISIPETVDIIIPDGAAKLMFGGDSPFKIYEMQVVNN
jgi:hypothetical protein